MPAPDLPLFVAERPDNMVWRRVDGLALVYHRPSALTHILAAPAPEILDVMSGGPLTAADVAARLAERYDIAEQPSEMDAVVAARLDELCGIGLVRRGA